MQGRVERFSQVDGEESLRLTLEEAALVEVMVDHLQAVMRQHV